MSLKPIGPNSTCLDMFLFPNKPVRTYNIDQLLIPFDSWLVQPKWDGHRAIAICDSHSNVTIFNREGAPLNLAKRNFQWLNVLDLPKPWVLDAELTRDGKLIVWDFAVLGGEYRFAEPYINRLETLQKLITKPLHHAQHSIELIETLPAKDYRNLLLKRGLTNLEGVVFKDPNATNMWGPYVTTDVASQVKFRFK